MFCWSVDVFSVEIVCEKACINDCCCARIAAMMVIKSRGANTKTSHGGKAKEDKGKL